MAHLSGASTQDGDAAKKFAELWIGTHSSLPAKIKGTNQTLTDYLSAHASTYFSEKHQSSPLHRNTVPYLLKVLSIGKALSIQAHPGRELAKTLHARDPVNYKDPNHKPELMVALTAFEALCCFRPLEQIQAFAAKHEALRHLISGSLPPSDTTDDAKTWIRGKLTLLYAAAATDVAAAAKRHLTAIGASQAEEDLLFKRLMLQYPDDVGCWMVYFLNIVHMSPGEGLFLSDCEPHSYLSGDGVEIMATSDNVVRAGLTPKFKDCETLLAMLTYKTDALAEAFHPVTNATTDASTGAVTQTYLPPSRFEDFSLQRVELPRGAAVSVAIPTVGLGICVNGSGTVNGTYISKGSCVAVSPAKVEIANGGAGSDRFVFFLASMNFAQQAAQT